MKCWNCKTEVAETALYCPNCAYRGYPCPIRFGQYLVQSFKGAGSFGDVYAVRHPDLDRVDAAKRLRIENADPDDVRAELQLVSKISHPNVVRIYFSAAEDNYYIMEYVAGTLEEKLVSDPDGVRQRLPEVAVGIYKGLQAAHRQRICHRDLKPANILIDEDWTPKLADFGLARFVTTASPGRSFAGTPRYIAPEVWNGEEYGLAADIFSLGVIFYRMWTGAFPFDATTENGLSLKILKGDYEPADALNNQTPAKVARLIDDMLAPADRRISSIGFIIAELTSYQPTTARAITVDDRQLQIAAIYGSRNYRRSPLILMAHPATSVSGLVGGILASDSEYGRSRAESYFPKVFAWICAVLSSLEWRVSQIVEYKYGDACPYCEQATCVCDAKRPPPELNRELLGRIRDRETPDAEPQPLRYYQDLFERIYGAQNKGNGIQFVCIHMLGAVNDVIDALLRVRSLEELREVDVLHLELADLVAWYFALLNMYDPRFDCETAFDGTFRGRCYSCGQAPCRCEPIENEIRLANWREFGRG